MKWLIYIVVGIILISNGACATLLNSDTQKVYVDHDSSVYLQIVDSYIYNRRSQDVYVQFDFIPDYLFPKI